MVGQCHPEHVRAFESSFASTIGGGRALSYASGRMAFFSLMRTLGIGVGDEVILPGFTCSVMANAILRVGATPVFSDIEESTLGSDPTSIKGLLSAKTKMIVAQHSFGYPCAIEAILQLSEQAGVFLLEDCATSLGTTVGGRTIGDFGNAAIFSTDHTKPINTLIGGMLYTRELDLLGLLRAERLALEELPVAKQIAVWKRMKLEASFRPPNRQWKLGARDAVARPCRSITGTTTAFLDEDSLPTSRAGTYPYPAPLPSFLAFIGLEQTENWDRIAAQRTAAARRLLEVIQDSPSGVHLPAAVREQLDAIVPLRIAWADPNAEAVRRSIQRFITTEGTWFVLPIVATTAPAEDFGYGWGTCPTAERQGPRMVNIPIPSEAAGVARLADLLAIALHAQ